MPKIVYNHIAIGWIIVAEIYIKYFNLQVL